MSLDNFGERKKDLFVLRCYSCKEAYDIDDYGKLYYCRRCGDLLEINLSSENKTVGSDLLGRKKSSSISNSLCHLPECNFSPWNQNSAVKICTSTISSE